MEYKIDKKDFSKQVVQKSLYWLSEYALWTLEENNTQYIVTITTYDTHSDTLVKAIFERHLNDFYLREKIDLSNKNLRESIINQALIAIYQNAK